MCSQRTRPRQPSNVEFDVDTEPDLQSFEVANISVGIRCHILFTTSRQALILSCAHTWYVDDFQHGQGSLYTALEHPCFCTC